MQEGSYPEELAKARGGGEKVSLQCHPALEGIQAGSGRGLAVFLRHNAGVSVPQTETEQTFEVKSWSFLG